MTVPIRIRFLAIALITASGSIAAACFAHGSANDPEILSRRMPDGKQWTTNNLNVAAAGSYCYGDAELNCRRYGRLYSWESSQLGCRSVGVGWRLPTDDEWRQIAKHYGGVREDSDDSGKAAYAALLIGGSSGFDGLLGGNRGGDGQYARLEAHGFYWTASETSPTLALFYNFGKGSLSLNRQSEGDKRMGASVRCIRDVAGPLH